MAVQCLPPIVGRAIHALRSEDLSGREIAELLWLAQQLRRQGLPLFTPATRLENQAEDGDRRKDPNSEFSNSASTLNPDHSEGRPTAGIGGSTARATRKPVATLNPDVGDDAGKTADQSGGRQGLPVRVVDPPLIRDPQRLSRSLRPLNRLVEAGPALWMDEEATVEEVAEALAEQRPWQPVLRPRLEPWLDLSLVLDRTPSMALWAQLEKELPRFFSRYLRLRDVRIWHLVPGPSGPNFASPSGCPHQPVELLRADRRQLVMVVSDACDPAWFNGTMLSVLQVWTRALPTVLLQVLPEWMWEERTALGGQRLVGGKARVSMQASNRLDLCAISGLDPEESVESVHDSIPILPVLELKRELLSAWAQLVAGDPKGAVLAYGFETHSAPSAHQGPPVAPAGAAVDGEMDVERKLASFLVQVSPGARRLISLLAFTPLITLPVVRLIQREIQEGGAPYQFAEVLMSGLLRRRSPSQARGDGAPIPVELVDSIAFDFLSPQLRQRLKAGVTVGEARQVYDRVEAAVAENIGCSSLDGFRALLRNPDQASEKPEGGMLESFARISCQVLRGLGGRYEKLAREVEAAWNSWQPPPAQNEEQLFTFHTATLQRIPLEPLPPVKAPGRLRANISKALSTRPAEQTAIGYREPLHLDPSPDRPTGSSIELEMVGIPAGTFLMGSPDDEPGRTSDEGPQHEVKLKQFFLARTPITQAQWREVARWRPGEGETWKPETIKHADPSFFKGDQLPVDNVSWQDAMAFCKRLSQRSGKTYTLPSEAQWEYACRAETTKAYCYGASISADQANFNGKATTDVGTFPSNAWGLYDMHGNVWEWCADTWHENYQNAPNDGSAWVDVSKQINSNKQRVEEPPVRLLRGGAWHGLPVACRSAFRAHYPPSDADRSIGFRVCCLPRGLVSSSL